MIGIIARVIVSLFVVFVLLAVCNAVIDFVSSKNRELVLVSFSSVTPPYVTSVPSGQPETRFHAGQRIFIHLDQERKQRDCIVSRSFRVTQFINGDPLHRIIWHDYNTSRGSTTVGHYSLDLSLVLPDDLLKGKYNVEIVSDYACNEGRYWISAPLIPFDVT